MTKMLSSILGMVLAFSIAIMLASAGSASSVLGATSSTGNANGNSAVKSSNMTSSGSMMNKTGVGNMSRAGNAKAGKCQKQVTRQLSPVRELLGRHSSQQVTCSAVTKPGQAVGVLKGLGNLISPGENFRKTLVKIGPD